MNDPIPGPNYGRRRRDERINGDEDATAWNYRTSGSRRGGSRRDPHAYDSDSDDDGRSTISTATIATVTTATTERRRSSRQYQGRLPIDKDRDSYRDEERRYTDDRDRDRDTNSERRRRRRRRQRSPSPTPSTTPAHGKDLVLARQSSYQPQFDDSRRRRSKSQPPDNSQAVVLHRPSSKSRRSSRRKNSIKGYDSEDDSGPEEYSVHGSKAWDYDYQQHERKHRARLRAQQEEEDRQRAIKKMRKKGMFLAGAAVLLAGLVWFCWSDDDEDDLDRREKGYDDHGKRSKSR